jgi:hypothetical protein
MPKNPKPAKPTPPKPIPPPEPFAANSAESGYAEHRSRSHDAVIRVYDAAGCVINIQTEYEHRFLLPALS